MTDWERITAEVNEHGGALTPRLLTAAQAEEIAALYDREENFRSTIDVARYRFGRGQYRYFQRPYPEPIEALKQALPAAAAHRPRLARQAEPGRALAGHARRVTRQVRLRWADEVDGHSAEVRRAGLERAAPRPLWRPVFPLQVVVNLNPPGRRPHWRRVPARRAASSGTIPWYRKDNSARARLGLRHPGPSRPISAGLVSGTGAARRVRDPVGAAVHPGSGLSRRCLIGQW